jgi:PAS domain S-box-containing protein
MEPAQSARLEHILSHISVGIALLGCSNQRIRFANQFFLSLLAEPWCSQGVANRLLAEVVPEDIYKAAQPLLQQVCATGQSITLSEVPYEGFLEARGRTYWHISIEFAPYLPSEYENGVTQNALDQQQPGAVDSNENELLITIEDVTNSVRSRLYLNAIHHISSAIAGPFALPLVLDRILQAVHELAGSTRCAVLLIDDSVSSGEPWLQDGEEEFSPAFPQPIEVHTGVDAVPTATIAAQKGLHLSSQDWHPEINEQLLLGQVVRNRRTFIIRDTSTTPEIALPLLNEQGIPWRPGSVLCVPIFEPTPQRAGDEASLSNGTTDVETHTGTVLGAIEVYHRRARGFPAEEVKLLEQFAQQAGLAIQNARFFRRINRLAREARRYARQQKNVMQAIPDGVIIYDARWRVADANDAVRKLLGWSDDVIGLHVTEALKHSTATFEWDSAATPDLVAELERGAMARRVAELKVTAADGQQYTMRRSQAPILDTFGDIFAFVVVYHDMTEQAVARERTEAEVVSRTAELAQRNQALQDAQAAVQLESARLQILLERLPSGVMLISADGTSIDIMNHQAVQLLQRIGWADIPLQEVYQQDHESIVHSMAINIEERSRTTPVYGASGAVIPYEEQPLFRALHKGEASAAELHITRPDGETLFLLVNAAPVRASDETISNAVLVWQDITNLKALERAREDFFTTMAHELKTPLANIRAHLSALQAQDRNWSSQALRNQEMAFYLETADEQVERLVGMINSFLDASRVEAGALRLDREPILLPEMFEDLQDRLEALITSSGRHLQINAALDLPAVLADYELIMSVLTNLLSNAFRYAPEGDTVLLEAELLFDRNETKGRNSIAEPTGVEIRVTDRGPGISEELQAELFTRFSTFAAQRRPVADRPGQPVPPKRRGGQRWSPATGLGLYISRGIIEAHGSTLRLISHPGQGATFAFTLPLASSTHKQVQ